jgi:ABC-2 type transport system permease protein
MSENVLTPPPVLPEKIPSPEKVLRKLFLTLFLRGRGARGLRKNSAPKSVFQKLALTLFFYFAVGCMALAFKRQPVFALAIYMHAMTFVFLGMFVASSAGEILFNKEEGDILLHRPIEPKTLLWAKIRVLVEVSLWLAGAFNLVGLFVGYFGAGGWRFPIAHIISTTLEALFCTGCIVLVYQLCLRWFGRERLEGLMTTAQVFVAVAAVLSGQILPRLVFRVDHVLNVTQTSWWINFLPPAWFAGFDDAFAGSGLMQSWLLAALAVFVTAIILWTAFEKLAGSYETGLQALNETVSARPKNRGKRRWLDQIVNVPPMSWWLRDPVTRASFLLVAAYLMRDRDVKLRIYPGIAPMLILPFVFLFQNQGHHHAASSPFDFGIPFAGVYLGLIPLLGLNLLQYSQQWQASDIFRYAPMIGPAPICHGARLAVLCFLTLPMLLFFGITIWIMRGNFSQLLLLLPGIIALPVFALVPSLGGKSIPLSLPTDAAKSAGRGLNMIFIMLISFALAGLAAWAFSAGYFWWLILGESILAFLVYAAMRFSLGKVRWKSAE